MLLIVCVYCSPSALTFDDTYNTLKYAKQIKSQERNLNFVHQHNIVHVNIFLPCSSTLLPSTSQLVRNVVSVDYHLSKYKEIVEDLQKEITHLKSKLASHGPIKGAFDTVEAARLKALISDVYGCHGNVRKELAEAECIGERLNAKRK